jgi:phosphoribosylamine-glycine ligase
MPELQNNSSKMKNYIIISAAGLGFFMTSHLGKGKGVEKVFFAPLDKNLKKLGQDMNEVDGYEKLEMVFDPFEVLNKYKPDEIYVVFDDVGWGGMADFIAKKGYKVVGSSELTDKMEDDRDFATKLFGRVMKTPETFSFDSFEEGIKFAKSQDTKERLVFKPNDSLVPKDMTYMSHDIPDLLDAMNTFRGEWKWKESFQLQRVVDGVLVDFGAWFNGQEYLKDSHYLYFENKPFLVGDKGPATGGEIAVVVYRANKGIFFDILEKLKPIFRKSGYRGQISINSIVSKEDKQPYFLELTPRFGYPSFPQDITALEENNHTLDELIDALCEEKTTPLFPTNKATTVIWATTPPYPNKVHNEEISGLPVSWDKKYDKYFFPYFVMYDKKKKSIVLTGNDASVLNVTCSDTTIAGAVEMTYEKYLPTIKLKNIQYRTDLGEDAIKRIKELKILGVI